MQLLIVHREYRLRGGEDVFLDRVLVPALTNLGITPHIERLPALFASGFSFIDALEVLFMTLGLERCRPSYWRVKRTARKLGVTHVMFNNFIPTVSLALPYWFKTQSTQVFLWVHNARFSCANGLLFTGSERCHRCFTHGSRWAFLQKCHGSWLQSLLYAFIYRGLRVEKTVGPCVDQFLSVSEYSAGFLRQAFKGVLGFETPLKVIRPFPGALPAVAGPRNDRLEALTSGLPRPFFTFLGRLSSEKGADRFVDLAKKFPDKGFLMAGGGPMLDELKAKAPSNLVFAGFANEAEKNWIFSQTEALIMPSRVPESAPLVILESHNYQTPVVFPAGGGAEETVKWLSRGGCSLEEFKGQTFSRGAPLHAGALEQGFTQALKKILEGGSS